MDEPTTLDYERVEPRKAHGLRFIHYVLIVIVALLVASIFVPSGGHSRRQANQIKCASNLRQIGQGIQLYAQANLGFFPPDLQTLAATQPLGLSVMICPSTSDQTPANIGAISAAGRCSYIYVGANLTSKADPSCILALEDPANHNLEGGNILFADGHVEFFVLPEFQFFLNELNAGRNPPSTQTPALSKAAAEQDYQKNWKSRMPQLKSGVWRIPTTQPAKAQ